MSLANAGDITQQALVEHDLLQHLVKGLRTNISWRVDGEDGSRKLSTLRFIAQSFQRHLERMMALEEYEGYMDQVATQSPHLGRRVDALRDEHARLREATCRVVLRLEQVSPAARAEFTRVCDDLGGLLDRVEEHSRAEVNLLQEAFHQDGGGEG